MTGEPIYRDNSDNMDPETGKWVELPRYNEEGALVSYLVKEEVKFREGITIPEGQQVFETTGTNFTLTNEYNPTEGSIKIQKHLYLPLDEKGEPEAYPAVTFQLTRQVKGADGSYQQDDMFSKTKVISSKQVEDAYDEATADGGTFANPLTLELEFNEDLDLYAPDGTEYLYTVTEIKDQLMGYDTWAAANEVEAETLEANENAKGVKFIANLTPKTGDEAENIQATFLNKQPDKPDTYTNFSATKVWQDYGNEFGFRPEEEKYKALLTLTRHADAQSVPGGGGAVEIKQVLDPSTYKLTIEEDSSDSSKWNISISTEGEFEKYAPNGMPWTYTLSEKLNGGKLELDSENPGADDNKVYTPSQSDGIWPNRITHNSGEQTNFGTLTNSIATSVWFEKHWVDEINDPITVDYLGFDLSVTFRLQVAVNDGGEDEWTFASDSKYVKQAFDGTYDDTRTLEGRVHESEKWRGSYTGLPTVVSDENGGYIFLKYRVIETAVSYGSNHTQTIPWDEETNGYGEITDAGLVDNAEFTQHNNTNISTNTLDTMEVSVKKVWNDGGNQYNTRPGANAPMTWTSWFVLQRSTDGSNWDNVAVIDLHGGNTEESQIRGQRWEHTFTGLPVADYSGGTAVNYDYRIRELQPKEGDYLLSDGDTINANIVGDTAPENVYNKGGSTYTTTYVEEPGNHWTVTNALDVYTPEGEVTQITAVKKWAVPEDDTTEKPDVTFQLQYRFADDPSAVWTNADYYISDAMQIANEGNNWTVVWENLPLTIVGQTVTYQVIEQLPGDSEWIQISQPVQTFSGGKATYTFYNTQIRSFSVEKKWNPATAVTHEVTVWLYRTTDSSAVCQWQPCAGGRDGPQRLPDSGAEQRKQLARDLREPAEI